MSSSITGVDRLRQRIAKMQSTINNLDKDLFVFLDKLIRGIKYRTVSQGADVDSNRFKRYSRRYIYSKGESGRAVFNVNLFYSGAMQNAIVGRKIPGGGEIYFNNEAEHTKAVRHQYGVGGMPVRKFFGLDKAQKAETFKKLERIIRGAVK